MLVAWVLALAASTDVLTDLERSSAGIGSFRARYTLVTSASPEPTLLEIDYVAPDRLRFDRTSAGKTTSMWSVEGVLSVRSNEGTTPFEGSMDFGATQAELEPVQRLLLEVVPSAKTRGPMRSVVAMDWSYDEAAAKANFVIEAQVVTDSSSALGWLGVLQRKGVEPREEGDLLRFSTDSHFDIALARGTGMLTEFKGRSPKGEMTVALQSVDFTNAPPAERFTVPAASSGAKDISSELVRKAARTAELELRSRIYVSLAGDAGPYAGADDARAKGREASYRIFAALHERTLAPVVSAMLERSAKLNEGVVKRLVQLRESGKSAEEVAAVRAKESETLVGNLRKLQAQAIDRSTVPSAAARLAHAESVLQDERALLHEMFESKLVRPLVASFEAACDAKLR